MKKAEYDVPVMDTPKEDVSEALEKIKSEITAGERWLNDLKRQLAELNEQRWGVKVGDIVRTKFGEGRVSKITWWETTAPTLSVNLKTKAGEWSKSNRNVNLNWAHV